MYIRIIFFLFVISGICLSIGTSLCTTPHNESHMGYSLDYKGDLQVDCKNDYNIERFDKMECKNQKWIGLKPICVKGACPNDVDPEQEGSIFTVFDHEKGIRCSDGYILVGNDWSYCNGTHWDRPLGTCQINTTETKYECDFEKVDLCGWTSKDRNYHNWTRNLAIDEFGSFSAGPTHDHTTMSANGGHYMVMKSSNQMGIDVPFFSPVYNWNTTLEGACFSFYYLMYGKGVGNLSVYLKPESIHWENLFQTSKYLKFNISGPQEMSWKQGTFDITRMEESFRIVFVASTSSHPLSDIAIDDVKLSFGSACTVNLTTEIPTTIEDIFVDYEPQMIKTTHTIPPQQNKLTDAVNDISEEDSENIEATKAISETTDITDTTPTTDTISTDRFIDSSPTTLTTDTIPTDRFIDQTSTTPTTHTIPTDQLIDHSPTTQQYNLTDAVKNNISAEDSESIETTKAIPKITDITDTTPTTDTIPTDRFIGSSPLTPTSDTIPTDQFIDHSPTTQQYNLTDALNKYISEEESESIETTKAISETTDIIDTPPTIDTIPTDRFIDYSPTTPQNNLTDEVNNISKEASGSIGTTKSTRTTTKISESTPTPTDPLNRSFALRHLVEIVLIISVFVVLSILMVFMCVMTKNNIKNMHQSWTPKNNSYKSDFYKTKSIKYKRNSIKEI